MATKKITPRRTGDKPTGVKSTTRTTPAKKARARLAPRKAPARSLAPAPRPVGTGRGPTPLDVGTAVVDLARAGRGGEVEKRWWAPGVVSVEGMGVCMEWIGSRAAHQKGADWEADHIVHDVEVEGPFVGATGFAIRFTMDVETKSTGQRERMEEVGVYTVQNGKIVREEFMYRAG